MASRGSSGLQGEEDKDEEEEEEEGEGGDVDATLRKNSSRAAVDERARVTSKGGGRRRFALVVAVLCRKRCSSMSMRFALEIQKGRRRGSRVGACLGWLGLCLS